MRILLIGAFCLEALVFYAQSVTCDGVIEGKILDIDTNQPLSYATINVKNTSQGAVADADGNFIIKNICDDEVDIEVRFIGYKTLIHHHDYHHSDPIIYMASEETYLAGVVVEENPNAHELKTLDSKDLEISSLDGIGENAVNLLARTTGVSALKTGQNVVKPIVHGLHSNRVLVINNGVRHSYQAWGADHGVEIDASQIDQIKLIKGASTVRYGADALGGVILFDAPKPSYATQLNGELVGGFQSNGRSVSGGIKVGEGYERIAWNASISGIKQGDLKAANYQLTNTGKEEIGFTSAGKFHFPAIDIDLFVSHLEQNLAILRGSVNGNLTDLAQAINGDVPNQTGSFSYEINNPRQETIHDLFKLSSSIFLGEQQFDVQYAFQRNLRKEFDVRRGTNNELPSIDLALFTHTLDLDWDHPSNGPWVGTYGLQFLSQNNDNIPGTNTIPFVPNYNNNSAGFFGVESYTIGKTTFEAGVRFDLLNMNVRGRDSRNDIYRDDVLYQNFTFTLGSMKQFNDHVSVRTNLGSAWRAPSVNELYSFGKHQSIIEFGLLRYELFHQNDSISTANVLTNGQKEVKSERGLKWITTFIAKKGNFEVEATPYINWIENYFFTRPYGLTSTVRGTFPYFIHDQTDALYTGLDLSVRQQWNTSLNSELKLSYVYAKDTRNNQSFIGIPPLNMGLTIEKIMGNFKLEVNPEWTAKQTNQPPIILPEAFESSEDLSFNRSGTFDFAPAPESFFLFNMTLSYTKDDLSLRVKGTNMLNKAYRRYTDSIRYYADDTGFNLGLFASYTF